jgi:hypothetical protein
MFSNLMRNFKLNLGSLDPELKRDLQKFRIAVYYGKQKEVEELIEKYKLAYDAFGNEIQNIDIVNYKSDPPFHDHIPLLLAVETEKKYMIELLLDADADINVKNSKGTTPLMKALYKGSYDIVDLLLNKGADIMIKNNDDENAFDIATTMVRRGQGAALVISIIKSVKDTKVKKDLATKALLMITTNYSNSLSETYIKFLLNAGADVHVKDSWGKTSLMGASAKGEANIVYLLLNAGADVKEKNNKGESPLFYAIQGIAGNNLNTIQLLLDYGAEFGDKEQRILNEANPELQEEVRKILDQQKTMMTSHMIQKEMKHGQYMEAESERDMKEYLMGKGGKTSGGKSSHKSSHKTSGGKSSGGKSSRGKASSKRKSKKYRKQ